MSRRSPQESEAHALAVLRRQAWHDMLTDLPNRARLRVEIERYLASETAEAAPVALLLLDLDQFKDVNDALGHFRGDMLLRQVGPRLRATLGESVLIARLGGDEFAALVPAADAAEAGIAAERLLGALEGSFSLDGPEVQVSASIGVALYPASGAIDEDALLRQAEVAMYVAKSNRRGFAVYAPELDRHSPARLALVGELRRAIEREELVLHYQPQIDVRSGALVGFEALARWPHPERGLISPDEFIPLAEQTRLIQPLSRWVVRCALRQCAAWTGTALSLPVAVNLSAYDLQNPRLVEFIEDALRSSGVTPDKLRLEITESSLMADPRGARDTLIRLRELGLRVAIDDFGTGYSSLEYLRNLPLDALKIDRSFVRDMATNEGARAIVRAVIDLADDLGLSVVAEGVEDAATWKVLAALGCDLAQGYYFSPPLPAVATSRWAAEAAHWQSEQWSADNIDVALAERVRERGARLAAEDEFIARKRAEEALRDSEERLRLAVEAAGLATWDWDFLSDTITWAGATSGLFGVEASALDTRAASFLECVHPEDRLTVESALAEARRSGELQLEYRTLRPDGSVRGLACTGRVLHDSSGRAVRLVGTMMDITARQHSERQREALAQTEKLRALGQLASGVAHDLNQSLLLIAGYGELARKAVQQPEHDRQELDETLALVTKAALDGGATVKRLLTFARAKPEGEPEPVDMASLLHDVAQLTAARWRDAAQAEGRSITLRTAADPDAFVLGWPASLGEALTNLIFNAVDALPSGGSIELDARCDGDNVVIEVGDTGVGMSPELQARVFEPFFSTKGDQGTGLGLAQVFGIVEQHHGRVSVRSLPGRGTTFELTFPKAKPSAPSAALAQNSQPSSENPRTLRILAVDDEPAIGSMVVRILRPQRHSVRTATSAEEALELLAAEEFDLVVSDLGLGPGMSGWDLAARVQATWPRVRFILATGWGAAIDAEDARARGVAEVLAKPYHPEELQRAVAQAA